MIARVDGQVTALDELWWAEMNFGQFRGDGTVGEYELELPRAEFVDRLAQAYHKCVAELQVDDALIPEEISQIGLAGYPPLETLPDHPTAFLEAVKVYLGTELFMAFLPKAPAVPRFMINSIDSVAASPISIFVRGRGYYARPGDQPDHHGESTPDDGPVQRGGHQGQQCGGHGMQQRVR